MVRPAEKKWPWRKLRSEAEPAVTEAAKGPIFAGRGPRRRCAQAGANAHKRLQVYDQGVGSSTGPVRDSERIRRKWMRPAGDVSWKESVEKERRW